MGGNSLQKQVSGDLLLASTVVLFITGGIICETLYESQELRPKDLEGLVRRYQEKVEAEEGEMCPRRGSAEELVGLRRWKVEAEEGGGFLEELAAWMSEGKRGEGEVAVSAPVSVPGAGLKFHNKPENVGEDFDILRIMKVVEERKNATRGYRPCKPAPLAARPGKEPPHWKPASPSACHSPPPPPPPTPYCTQCTTPCPTPPPPPPTCPPAPCGSKAEPPPATPQQQHFYPPAFPQEKQVTEKSPGAAPPAAVTEKEEGLKSLLDAFVPLLKGRNVSDLQRLEENLLREMNETTDASVDQKKTESNKMRGKNATTLYEHKKPAGNSSTWEEEGKGRPSIPSAPNLSSFADEKGGGGHEGPPAGGAVQPPEGGTPAAASAPAAPAAPEPTTELVKAEAKSKQEKTGFFSFLGNLWKKSNKGNKPAPAPLPSPDKLSAAAAVHTIDDLYKFLAYGEHDLEDVREPHPFDKLDV